MVKIELKGRSPVKVLFTIYTTSIYWHSCWASVSPEPPHPFPTKVRKEGSDKCWGPKGKIHVRDNEIKTMIPEGYPPVLPEPLLPSPARADEERSGKCWRGGKWGTRRTMDSPGGQPSPHPLSGGGASQGPRSHSREEPCEAHPSPHCGCASGGSPGFWHWQRWPWHMCK